MNVTESILEFWFSKFHVIGEGMIPFFVNCSLPKGLFLSKYKTLPPIEEMLENEKSEMKKFVIGLFPNRTTEEKLEACKIIYTIGNLL